MAEEFVIKSETLETEVNRLLPSQGGYGAGVDLSASSMIVPIVDLTQTAEGSALRQDLQTAICHNNTTTFDVTNTATTIINTTGYYRIFGSGSNEGLAEGLIQISDGTTTKDIVTMWRPIITSAKITHFDINIFLGAGDSAIVNSPNANISIRGISYQIADISGNFTNPS